LEGQGRADLHLRLHGAPSALQYNGTARLASAQLRTPSLTKPIEVSALDARFEARSARVDKFRLKLGSSTAEGQANITSFTPPRANLTLAIDQLDSAELAALVKNEAPPLRLTNITTQAAFGDQRLVLSPLNADLYGGKHRGEITIGFAGANPTYAIRSQLDAIESSQLLGVITPALRQVISGPLSAQLNLDLASASGTDLARALNGQIKLNFSKGRLLSFNLLEELSSLAKFLRINPQSEKMTSFLALTGDLNIKDGLATTDNLKLDLDKASTTLSGTLGLTDQKLNLRLQTVLTRAYSDEIGGTRIGGYLSSAVANQRGELVLPTLVTGTFGQPRFTPDAGAIAKLKMQNVMQPGSVKENVRGVIDLFKKRPAAPKP
ncbi:MAG: AsmA-like C-terminal region-containing protein, partial [Bryobacteraceae bacterium]|nr:AsmA-like C-terminal region-containing protein [Bryobacteraceae bacterium]